MMVQSMDIKDYDRHAVAKILRCFWMCEDRLQHLDGSRDFTGGLSAELGQQVLDLNTGTFSRVDYKIGTHGFLDIAKALPDSVDDDGGYMTIAATIPVQQGKALLKANRYMQRR